MAEAAAGFRRDLPALGLALAGAALAFVPDWRRQALIAALLLFALATLWIVTKPERWPAVFAATTLLAPPLAFPLGDSGLHPAVFVAGAGLAAGLLRLREWRLERSGLLPAGVVLLAVLAGSCAWAAVASGPAIAAASLLRTALFGIALYAFADLCYGPAGRAVDSARGITFLLWAALGSGLIGCLDFLLQWPPPAGFAEQFVWLSAGVYRRAQGVFYEAGLFGGVAVFFLSGTALAVLRRGEARRLAPALLWAALGLTMFAALLFSFSRSAMLALGVSLALLLALHAGDRRLPAGLGLAAAAGLLSVGLAAALEPEFVTAYGERFAWTAWQTLSDPRAMLGERLESWSLLLGFLDEHPWRLAFGVGFKTLPYTSVVGRPVVADNMFISLLVETGLAGLSAALVFFAAILHTAYRAARSSNPRAAFLGAWSLCFWTGQLVQMFWVDVLTYWRALPVYLGVLALAERERRR